MLSLANPDEAENLLNAAQNAVNTHWKRYETLAKGTTSD
jgi:hypothetical protein